MRYFISVILFFSFISLTGAEAIKAGRSALDDSTIAYKIQRLQKKVSTDSMDQISRFKLGVYFYNYKYQFPEAILQWQEVLKRDPADGQAHFFLAWVYYSKLFDYDQAEYHALMALDQGLKTRAEKKYWYKMTHWVLANLYEDKEDLVLARKFKQQWLNFYRPPQPRKIPKPILREEIARLRVELGIDPKPKVTEKKKEKGQVKL